MEERRGPFLLLELQPHPGDTCTTISVNLVHSQSTYTSLEPVFRTKHKPERADAPRKFWEEISLGSKTLLFLMCTILVLKESSRYTSL